MDIRAEKVWLIEQISKISDERLLKALRGLLECVAQKEEDNSEQDFWDELSDEQKKRIEMAIQEMDEGKGIPHDVVMEEYRTRYSKEK